MIFFVRHAELEKPFSDYEKVGLDTLDALATARIDPRINKKVALKKVKELKMDHLGKIPFKTIYHSSSTRARETAEMLASELSVPDVRPLECLDEITFSPKKLISKQQFEEQGMGILRESVFNQISEGKNIESNKKIRQRLTELKKLCDNSQDDNILFVTHGFYMRLIQIFFKDSMVKFSVANQQQAINYNNLMGFSLDKRSK